MRPALELTVILGVAWVAVRSHRRSPTTFWKGAVVVGVLNFLAFVVVSAVIGGGALFGKVVGNHYFVNSHGRFTAVSPWVWYCSLVQAVSQLITFPLIVMGWFVSREEIEDAKEGAVTFRGRGAV